MKKKTKGILALVALLIIPHLIFVDNKTIDYEDFNLPVLNDLKIAHLSDLHFPKIKVNLDEMLERIEGSDVILLTGDLVDRSANIEKSGVEEFIKKLVNVAKVLYVNGNHETANDNQLSLYQLLTKYGVYHLDDTSLNLTFRGNTYSFLGLNEDSLYLKDNYPGVENNPKILLTHRPELFAKIDFQGLVPDIIFTGHAHGGQYRIFGQGIYAPSQGLFPKYTSGLYQNNETMMIVSRGLGNSVYPWRFNNLPHVPLINF